MKTLQDLCQTRRFIDRDHQYLAIWNLNQIVLLITFALCKYFVFMYKYYCDEQRN